MSLSIHRIKCLDLVAKRSDEWTEFSNRHTPIAPFCRAATWISWFKVYRENKPLVFELRDGPELIALLPMYRKAMTLHMATEFHLDYQEIAAKSVTAAIELLKGVIDREGEKGLALSFHKTAEHSRLFAALSDPAIRKVASVQSRYQSVCPTVTYPVTEEKGVFAALRSRQRQDHRASKRRLDQAFPDHFVEHCEGSEIDDRRLKAIGELHRANQYRRSGPSIFVDPGFSQFLAQQVGRKAPLSVSILWEKEGGAPLAFDIGYFADDTYFYYMTAYASEQAKLSPGRYLLVESLIHFSEQVVGDWLRFDMLSGEEEYKSRWAKNFYEVSCIQVIPKLLVNLPRVAAFSAVYGLKTAKNRLRDRLVGERLGKLVHEDIELPS